MSSVDCTGFTLRCRRCVVATSGADDGILAEWDARGGLAAGTACTITPCKGRSHLGARSDTCDDGQRAGDPRPYTASMGHWTGTKLAGVCWRNRRPPPVPGWSARAPYTTSEDEDR